MYDLYHGYRYFDKKGIKPLFPFGYGLSYTKFRYEKMELERKKAGIEDEITVKVTITNIGKMPGEVVVQVYVGYENSRINRPLRELKGFKRVHLEPGDTTTVEIPLRIPDLAYWNEEKGGWEVERGRYTIYAGRNSMHLEVREEVEVG